MQDGYACPTLPQGGEPYAMGHLHRAVQGVPERPEIHRLHDSRAWFSSDGRVVKADVVLDGDTDEDGTTRAAYRPGGAMDADDFVHTERWVNAGLWMPWLMAIAGVTFIAVQLRAGRRDSK